MAFVPDTTGTFGNGGPRPPQDIMVMSPAGVFSASLSGGSWQSAAARSRLMTIFTHRRHEGLKYGQHGE